MSGECEERKELREVQKRESPLLAGFHGSAAHSVRDQV